MTVAGVSQSSTVDVSIKQTEVETSTYQQQVTASAISVNEQILATQNSLLERNQTQAKDIQDQLSPPPTKQEQNGKRSITVVDKEEVRKLESSLAATKSQIASAQGAVDNINAQQEALKGQSSSQQSQTAKAQTELNQAQNDASSNGHSGASRGVNTNASVTGSAAVNNSQGSNNSNLNGHEESIQSTNAGTEAST